MAPSKSYFDAYQFIKNAPKNKTWPKSNDDYYTLIESFIQCFNDVSDSTRLYRQSEQLLVLGSITKYSSMASERMLEMDKVARRLPGQIQELQEVVRKISAHQDMDVDVETEEFMDKLSSDEKKYLVNFGNSAPTGDLNRMIAQSLVKNIIAQAQQVVEEAGRREKKQTQ